MLRGSRRGSVAGGLPEEVAVSRYASPVVDVPEWMEVSTEEPCPICGSDSQCKVLEDGEFACCVKTVCDWPVLTGGWLHRLSDARDRTPTRN
jgi:hypothetical protein